MFLQKQILRNKQNSLKNWRRLKKILNEEIDYLLFEDESMIRDYQAIQKTWFAKGKQRIIQTYGKHEGVKLVGFLNYETGKVYIEEHKTYNAEVFKFFYKMSSKNIHRAKLLWFWNNEPCEKISVNSTTVIKNDIVERLEKQPLNFFTVYNKYRNLSSSSTVSLLSFRYAPFQQTDRAGSAQSVGVHDLQLAKNSAPVLSGIVHFFVISWQSL